MPEQHQALNFAGFVISVETNQLFYEGKAIAIESRQLKLLELLAIAYPEMVSKQELMDILWPETVVSEASLSRLISDTRKLLGTLGARKDLITTVHRRGFCLGAEVHLNQLSEELSSTSEPKSAIAAGLTPDTSDAVLLSRRCVWILSAILLTLLGLIIYLVAFDDEPSQSNQDYTGVWQVILQVQTRESALNSAGKPVCTDTQQRYDVMINKKDDSYYLLQPQFAAQLGPDLSQPVTLNLEYPDAGGYVTTEMTISFTSMNRMKGHSTWEWRVNKGSKVLCSGDSMFDAVK
ncbi:winged helix-turn-helix domain-containing protein [Shewanella submarina]|uniref:Transcriptional regulator n=1 Tax=Shewanella submarina TaxID=2016376 RepID=A0ABV7G7T2_9GAMM|nr:winged helix-turn-helix domain-containing protein [Shewanella submarina]MCL1037046.1 winged helix-turn-helix domain-containing protein [Shewanella submarina]